MVSLGIVRLLPIAYTPIPAHSPCPLALPEGVCRYRQALRLGCLVSRFATLSVTQDTLRYVPAFRSNRLGAELRSSPALFVGYRFDAGKAHLSRAPYLLAIRSVHRTSNVHRGLRWVAPPAPPLLRLVCSPSGALTSSALRPAE